MKFEKFVPFSLIHTFLLLAMAVFISSCQKKTINSQGYFSKYDYKSFDRSPASVPNSTPKLTQFDHTQDSKQIYIYCAQSSLKIQQCYEHHFNQILSDFINKNGVIEAKKLISLKESNKFELVQAQVMSIQDDILENLNTKISQLVSKREDFCRVNSKIDIDKCMNQYIERDSLAVLNAYQYENKRLNGHEYIFLKNAVHSNLKAKLEISSKVLEKNLAL